MTNAKSKKRALLSSVMALFLCFVMLLGTTYAWFTDGVTSANNIIKSGNLDVELYWSTDATDWKKVNESTNVFSDTPWEPGHTEVVYLKAVNEGSLALKYSLGINIVSETAGINANDKPFKLSDYIRYGIVETDTAFADRAEALKAVERGNKTISSGYTRANELKETNATDYVAMVVYMPETVGNEANYKKGFAPEIKLGINLMATQYTYEEDSYGNDFDAAALPCDIIATPETIQQILDTCEPGTVIGLSAGGYYEPIVIKQNDITLIANPNAAPAYVDFINLNSKNNIVLDGITFDAYIGGEVKGVSKDPGLRANIVGATTSSYGASNIQIRNCEFVAPWGSTSNYVPIAFYENGRKSGAAGNIVIDNCKFLTDAERYIYIDYAGDKGGFTITNNTFGTFDTVVDDWAIRIGYTKADVTISGNTFINCGVKVNPHNGASCSYALNVAIVENEFYNTTDQTLTAIGCKYFHALPQCQLLVKDNVINSGTGKFEDSYVDDNDTCYDIVAAGNIAGASDTESVKDAIKNGAEIIFVNGANVNLDSALNTTFVPAGKTVTIANAKVEGQSYGNKVDGTVVFENCTFEADVYSIHFDGGTGKVVFNNCTLVGWSSFGSVEVEMNNCTIKGNGTYGVARFYKNAVLKDCVIDVSDVDTTDGYQDGIDIVAGYTVTMINCTNANGDIKDVFEAEDIAGTDGTVVFQ